MATLATLVVKLAADSASLIRGTKQARKEFRNFTGGIEKDVGRIVKAGALIGTGIAAGLSALAASRFSVIDDVAKLGDAINATTEDIAAFRLAASLTGVSTSELDKGLERLTRTVGDAARAPGLARDAINALGIDLERFSQLDAGEQFREISERITQLGDRTEQAAIANALFGRSGVRLLNTLDLGRDGLDAVADEAERYGLAVSRVDAKQIENANDAIERAKSATDGLGNTIAVAVSPFVTELATRFSTAALESNGFRDQVSRGMEIAGKAIGIVASGIQALTTGFAALNVPLTGFVSLARLAGAAVAGEFQQGLDDAAAAINAAKEAATTAALDLSKGTFSNAVLAEFERIRQGAEDERAKLAADIAANEARGTASGVVVPGFAGADAAGDAEAAAAAEEQRQQAELERIRQFLATKQQLEVEAFLERARVLDELELQEGETELDRQQLRLENIQQFNAQLLAEEQKQAAARLKIEQQAQKRITGARAAALNSAVGFLQSLAGESKAAAIAAIALNKGLAIASAIQNTAVAATRAVAELGPIAGPPAAAAIIAWGALQVAAIAATGLAQVGSVASSGAPVGSPANPVTTTPATAFDQPEASAGRLFVDVDLTGIEGQIFTGESVRNLVDALVETINDGGGRELTLSLNGG